MQWACVLLCTLESAKTQLLRPHPLQIGEDTLQLDITVARYQSNVLLVHRQRLAQTGTSTNNCQEWQVNDARACRLVISRRNVIIDWARNAGTEHPAYCTDHYSACDYKDNYRGLPPDMHKPNSGLWTRDYYSARDYKKNYRGLPSNMHKPNSGLWTRDYRVSLDR